MAQFELNKETVDNIKELVRFVKEQDLTRLRVGSLEIENTKPGQPSAELLKTIEKLNRPVTDEQLLENPMHGLEFTQPN